MKAGFNVLSKQADNNFPGYKIAAIVFILVAVVTVIRSCIHILAPDGGAVDQSAPAVNL
jgi:hypothetical protein